MMRQSLSALTLHLLGSIVQVKVDEDRIDIDTGVFAQDLAPDHLDASDACAADLALPRRARGDGLVGFDLRLELWSELETV